MLWGNDAVAVYVRVDDWPKDHEVPGIEALMWPDEKHPHHLDELGQDMRHLVRVSYLYSAYRGWVKRDRIIPRS